MEKDTMMRTVSTGILNSKLDDCNFDKMKRRLRVRARPAAIFFIIIFLMAWQSSCVGIGPRSGDVVLRLSGSNTIGAKLAPALVEAYLKKKGAEKIKRIDGANAEELTIQAVLPGDSVAKTIEIKAHGSDTAVKAFENDECDIGMLSRKLKPEEAQKLSAKLGDLLAYGSENVIAMDGIAIIVNKSNVVRELTLPKIAQVFTGEITDWHDLDNRMSGSIDLYARDDKSGTFDTFKNLVLGKEKKLASAKRFEDSQELSDAVASDPKGIGFVGLPYIGHTFAIAVSEEGIAPLYPNSETINRRKYPLNRELYFYLPSKSANKLAKELVAFAISDDGQDVASEVGFISQKNPPPQSNPTPAVSLKETSSIPADLARIRRDYNEAYIAFYFTSGGKDFDNKSLDDLGRFVSFLQKQGIREILLVGFADNVGADQRNIDLSIRRAESVKSEFLKAGVNQCTATGFGKAAPIASNSTPTGQAKNRRVEVYYR